MLTLHPSPPLRGAVPLPGDKSLSHRAALFAALADGESHIEHFLDAGVTRRMLAALSALGVDWDLDSETLVVQGRGPEGLQAPTEPLDCGHSATTLRLLAGALAAAGLPAVLDGSEGLRRRPMGRILQPLQAMGVPVHADGDHAPLHFRARPPGPLAGGAFTLQVASAQVKTCLLLAGLAADRPLRICEPGPSRDHSERLLAGMGAAVTRRTVPGPDGRTLYETVLEPGARLAPLRLRLPGDFSAAAFLIAAAAIVPGSDLTLESVGLNPTRTGLLDALRAMGAAIEVTPRGEAGGEPFGDLRVRYSRLVGTEITGDLVVRMIDEFPAFAAAAAFAHGETVVREAGELRHKESDRIAALVAGLRAAGAAADELPDGFILHGGGLPGGAAVDAAGDHRIAMALAVAALAADRPVGLHGAAIAAESFPGFFPLLQRLGARIDAG